VNARVKTGIVGAAAVALWCVSVAQARGDPIPVVPVVPSVPVGGLGLGGGGLVAAAAAGGGGGAGLSGGGSIGAPGIVGTLPNLAPATAGIFLCPGVGAAASVVGGGGGYCDFDFQTVPLTATTFGVMHIHCEWGGFAPLLEIWQCWTVFPGQPDHPAHVDPRIIPDGFGVPWAILGPSPDNQWPPPGLAPGASFAPPPPDTPPPPPPPPMFPPWDQADPHGQPAP
jgi:hypothetical protein